MATKKQIRPKVGDNVEFNGNRIHLGNPVRGTVTAVDSKDFTVKLEHDIEGLVTIWYAGAERIFPYLMISDLKIIKP